MQELLLQYRILPISQARHSCSSSLQGLHQAYIPLPCRDIGHLGMIKTIPEQPKDYWQKP
uniref:Uncharacterized protein n=1 Tax=Peromyscus maniculatus bairdii TaxID=230844 RepID=A0A8C8U9V8_PERMB